MRAWAVLVVLTALNVGALTLHHEYLHTLYRLYASAYAFGVVDGETATCAVDVLESDESHHASRNQEGRSRIGDFLELRNDRPQI